MHSKTVDFKSFSKIFSTFKLIVMKTLFSVKVEQYAKLFNNTSI